MPRRSRWSAPHTRRVRSVAVFLGEDLLAYLVLALGAALAVGSAAALIRPPDTRRDGDLAAAPVARSVVMIVIGSVAALWALASLVAG